MIERHRSLIHMLMSGLVGLTLGLFIGWWVWPVQWAEAPVSQPAASVPTQTVESPAEEGVGTDSSYSTFLDLISQGLLYVAAALLLAGGVVIGYQLLRQSRDKESTEKPFPLPFSRSRSKQATAPHEPRAKGPPLAGRPVRQRQTSLNWLHKDRTSEEPADTEEPVFTEQQVAATRSAEPPPPSQHLESETELRENSGGGNNDAWIRDEDTLEPDAWEEQVSIGRDSPLAVDEPGLDSPAFQGTSEGQGTSETATAAYQESGAEQTGEHFPAGQDDDLSRAEPLEGEAIDSLSEERQTEISPAISESAESVEGRDSEDRELWKDDEGISAAVATPRDVSANREDWEGDATVLGKEAAAAPETPILQQDMGRESSPISKLGPGAVVPGRGQTEPAPAAHTSRQMVGKFEANYAYGIQSYDESFTINGADGELLGACGMGINESVDRAAANLDHVRLLDIWLYDRSEVRSVSQPLVSPGFDVTGLNDHVDGDGSVTSPPLEVASGLTCALRSDGIVLECTIKSATFLDGEQVPPPFRSVSATLAVYILS